MTTPQEKPPTFTLRQISDRIQAKTTELFLAFTKRQLNKHRNSQQDNQAQHEESRIRKITNSSEKTHFRAQQGFIEIVKNELCRIISSELPIVVNYETKINDKIEDLEQQLTECKKLLKLEKQNSKELILQRDNLKVQILSKQHQAQQVAEQFESYKIKYDEAMLLVNTYMKEIQSLQSLIHQLQAKTSQSKQEDTKYARVQKYQDTGFSSKQLTVDMASPKSNSKQFNYPLQMRQKLNDDDIVLNKSPRSNNPQIQSSHFKLSNQIIDCQKQLLQIQLKNAVKDKAQLLLQLQEQRNYSKNLEKEVDNLQKLVDGQKRLNEKLDRELYTLINATKEMKIELLEERAKNKQLEEEVYEMQQEIGSHEKERSELEQKITQLEAMEMKVSRLEDEVNEGKAKLQISNKKYEQLRRIKQQLQQKIQEFEGKIIEIERKQAQDEVKQMSFQATVKLQNISKIKQIEEMSLAMRQKYERKIQVIEKHYKEGKEKWKYYKQENAKLYESFEIQSKKQAKMEEKFQKTKARMEELVYENEGLKRDVELVGEKLKTQTLLSKELKRELISSEKSKAQLHAKLKKFHSKLPNLISQIQSLKQQTFTLKSIFQTYHDILKKLTPKHLLQFNSLLQPIFTQHQSNLHSLQSQLNQKITLLEHQKKQTQLSENQKIKLIQRLNALQSKDALLQQQIQAKQNQFNLLNQRFSLVQSINAKLQKQIQNYRKIEKSGLQQIQILRQKHKEIEQFYTLIDELANENKMLKKNLDQLVSKNEEHVTFSKNQNTQKDYFYHHSYNSHRNMDQVPSYLIPQKQSKEKSSSRSRQGISNSHSCVHLRPLSKNKSQLAAIDPSKNISYEKHEKHLLNKSQYDQTVPNQLPIHSRPVIYNSRKSHKFDDTGLAFSSSELLNLRDQKNPGKYNFQSQKQRLEEIKLEYQKMMADKFREQFIQKMTQQRMNY